MKSLEYKAELALVKAQNIDVTNFENDLETFKMHFHGIMTSLPDVSKLPLMKSTNPSITYKNQRCTDGCRS